ncbi:MAG: phospho-N-acetylmuramoyl-pentapeptide-transferase [Gemmatimonadetes bacterium]|nr:phospho-N-acetylmuramoyl-pentapeptide-transferase [Gemmatimonadota bacterium]
MVYEFLTPLASEYQIFNLFTYISFRAAGAMGMAVLVALVMGPWMIRMLSSRKVGQVIRSDGPDSHHSKQGTPTMGGLVIIFCTVVPTVLWARLDNAYVLVAIVATIWMGFIGFVDDYLKVVQGKSRGLIAKYKLIGQVSFGVALGIYLLLYPPADTLPANSTTLPFFKYSLVVMVPALYVLFTTLIVTGYSNAVNLTDGLDGLAAGLSVIAAAAFALFAYLYGRVDASEYLRVFYLEGSGELAVFCASLMGACLGFLWYNSHPAQVFMGDTGSMAIGGAFGTVAILLKSEFLLLIIGGVFAAEAGSVLLQTGVYKWRKRQGGRQYADQNRLFRMAPIHHHFEKLGWTEPKVVSRFYIAGIICALVALSTLKVR